MFKRFEVHSHTHYSNLRLLDCINRPKDLVKRAIELGLSGIAITDHETLSSHIELNIYQKEVQKEHPDFKIELGNEIYLINERGNGQKYFHFILIAKNKQGHQALKELSSTAWMNSYWDRGLERVAAPSLSPVFSAPIKFIVFVLNSPPKQAVVAIKLLGYF